MIKVIEGDLIQLAKENYFNAIIHGCNCKQIMGAGIAKQIAINFPKAQEVDLLDNKTSIERLGNYSVALCPFKTQLSDEIKKLFVYNLYQQYNPGKDLNYNAFELGLFKINYNLKQFKEKQIVGLPYNIGCGIAGGDWNIVSKIIKKQLVDCEVILVNLKK